MSFAYIEGLTSKQKMYAAQASYSVELTHPKSDISCTALLMSKNNVNNESVIYIEFDEEDADNFKRLPAPHKSLRSCLIVKFLVNYKYFSDLTRSVREIPDSILKQLIPQKEDFRETKHHQMNSALPEYLDSCQVNAIRKIVCCQSAVPILISGPIGSGKTHLLCIATKLILDESQLFGRDAHILLCCHHQITACTLINMLVELNHHLSGEFVRVVSETAYRPHEQKSINISRFIANIPKYLNKKYLVIVTTYITSLRMNHNTNGTSFPPGFFTHIFIDEGAQSREPECIAPLCMANKDTQIVIVGDPMQVYTLLTFPVLIVKSNAQVGPDLIVLGDIARKNGLGESILQRLTRIYRENGKDGMDHLMMLCTNHRSHVDLHCLLSNLFYKDCKFISTEKYPLKFICSDLNSNAEELEPTDDYEVELILSEVKNINDPSNSCIMTSNMEQVCVKF